MINTVTVSKRSYKRQGRAHQTVRKMTNANLKQSSGLKVGDMENIQGFWGSNKKMLMTLFFFEIEIL